MIKARQNHRAFVSGFQRFVAERSDNSKNHGIDDAKDKPVQCETKGEWLCDISSDAHGEIEEKADD